MNITRPNVFPFRGNAYHIYVYGTRQTDREKANLLLFLLLRIMNNHWTDGLQIGDIFLLYIYLN